MKICVVGAGALGSLVAGFIKARTREDVALLVRSPEDSKKIKADGLKIEMMNGSVVRAAVKAASAAKDMGPRDLVIICVKSYSTEDACKDIKDMVGAETRVLTLQNGIGNVQILNDHFGPEKVIAGITNHGATLVGPGHVRHAGKGDTIIGKSDGKLSGALKQVSAILGRAGFETKISKDMDGVIWSKLVINVGINALTAVTRLKNGKLLEYDHAHELLKDAVQEAVRVVKRKRVKLAYDDPIQKVESVCKATAQNVSSMLQDVLNGKKTEIDFINGAIVRQAKALGMPAPVNEVLTGLVKTIESSYDKIVK